MKILSSILLLFVVNISFAQYQNILIEDLETPEEPTIIVNPYNTSKIIAATNICFCHSQTYSLVIITIFQLTME